jgi:hypothetical protein
MKKAMNEWHSREQMGFKDAKYSLITGGEIDWGKFK